MQLVKKVILTSCVVFQNFLSSEKPVIANERHPLMGFFRNYLPFRWRKISGFLTVSIKTSGLAGGFDETIQKLAEFAARRRQIK